MQSSPIKEKNLQDADATIRSSFIDRSEVEYIIKQSQKEMGESIISTINLLDELDSKCHYIPKTESVLIPKDPKIERPNNPMPTDPPLKKLSQEKFQSLVDQDLPSEEHDPMTDSKYQMEITKGGEEKRPEEKIPLSNFSKSSSPKIQGQDVINLNGHQNLNPKPFDQDLEPPLLDHSKQDKKEVLKDKKKTNSWLIILLLLSNLLLTGIVFLGYQQFVTLRGEALEAQYIMHHYKQRYDETVQLLKFDQSDKEYIKKLNKQLLEFEVQKQRDDDQIRDMKRKLEELRTTSMEIQSSLGLIKQIIEKVEAENPNSPLKRLMPGLNSLIGTLKKLLS
jgi:hypothetical protein